LTLQLTSAGAGRADRVSDRAISWKVAVVVPAKSDVMFGLSRGYELLREGSPERVCLFRDIGKAEERLGRP